MAKQDDFARITLRLPKELHERLLASSGARSLNAEIVDRLTDSYAAEAVTPRLDSALADLEAHLDRSKREDLEFAKFARDQIVGMRGVIELLLDTATDDEARDRIRALLMPGTLTE